MAGKESILGSQNNRVRTNVRLPKKVANQVIAMCEEIGVPQNAFYTIAACNQLRAFSHIKTRKKNNIMLDELVETLQKMIERIRNPE